MSLISYVDCVQTWVIVRRISCRREVSTSSLVVFFPGMYTDKTRKVRESIEKVTAIMLGDGMGT